MKHSILSAALLCALSTPSFARTVNVFENCGGKSVPELVECGTQEMDNADKTMRSLLNRISKAAESDSIRETMEHADKSWYEYMEADCGYRGETDSLQCKYTRYALRMMILDEEYNEIMGGGHKLNPND